MTGTTPVNDRIDAVAYHRDVVPGLLAGRPGALAAAGLKGPKGLKPLVLRISGDAWTYRNDNGRLRINEGAASDAVTDLSLSPEAWTDLVREWRSAAALAIGGQVEVSVGSVLDLFAWEPVLRALYQEVPIFVPNGPELTDQHGALVDLGRSLSLADSDAELAAFFEATGVMRIRGVFSADEIAALNTEVDRLASEARPGDDRSWWATNEAAEDVLCRIVYASERSDLIGGIAQDPRMLRLSSLLHKDLAPTVDRMEGIAVLIKPPGRLKGLANIPWHTDCGLGGHHIMCPSVAIGIQLSGSSPETGCLEAVAGTHGKTCPPPGDLEELPYMLIPTEPGDVTVHIADVLHASPAPTGVGGRRTMYVTYQPPSLFENIGPGEAVNDLVRRQTAGELEVGLGR